MPSRARALIRALAIFVSLTSLALAQGGAAVGSIAGIITESGGGPAAFASVTVVDQAGVSRALIAGEDGAYGLSDLPAGSYEITASSVRTHAFVRRTIELHSGDKLNIGLPLSGAWTILEFGKPSLPGNGNYLDALRAGSEITRGQEGGNVEGYGPYSPRGNFSFNSVGQRGQDNNFQVDGMDNNDPWLRGPVLAPPSGAIETVKFSAVYTPASEGHEAGGVVNVVTSSGASSWHGSVFDRLGNSALDARNFFDGSQKSGTARNQFGVNIGGPVSRNNWFVFANVEALRARDGLTVVSTVPTAAEKSGNFGSEPIYNPLTITQTGSITFIRQPFASNKIPASMLPAQTRNLINLYPDPNLPGLANNYRLNTSSIDNGENYTFRTDKTFSERDKVFARVSEERNRNHSPSALPGNAGNDITQHADNANVDLSATALALGQTFTLSPSTVNDFRAGFSRLNWNGVPADQSANPAALLGIPGLAAGGLPIVSPEGYAQLGAAQSLPAHMRSTSYELRDTIRRVKGRHTLEAGVQAIRREVDGDATDWTSRGTFLFTPDYTDLPNVANTGNSIASLLLGYPSEVRRDVQAQPYRLRGTELAVFAQDTFRVGRKWTIMAGLRYSWDPPVTEADDRMVNFNYNRTAPALDQFAEANGVNAYGGLSYKKLTIAPRIGFAFDVSGNGSTILRGGFSQNYDPTSYMAEGILARNAPYASRLDMFNGSMQLGPTLAGGLPAPSFTPLSDTASLNASQSSTYAIEPKSYTPYVDQWGLFLEHRLTPRLSVELAGLGSMGIHLYESYNINQPYPAPTPYNSPRYPFAATNARVEYLGFAGGSTYYGGQAKVSGRILTGLQLTATYRYAKSLDDSTQPETFQESRPAGPQYIYNLRGDRSPSPYDVPQRLTVTASYELAKRKGVDAIFGGWNIATNVTIQSGLPFTPQLAINGLNNGGYQLPDRVGSGELPTGRRSPMLWFNTAVGTPNAPFLMPDLYQYGNSGFDILRGPGMANVDAALSRSFRLSEKMRLRTRIEATNLLNRTNPALPNAILGIDSSGVISHTVTPSRQMQLVAGFNW